MQPLIFAHRGASHDAPENTLAAFTLAHTLGADGVELDTSLTRDGIPVVMHDMTLDKTTNARGPVRQYDLAAIKTFDAGSHHNFAEKFRGEPIPTLDEVFEALGPAMLVNVELKADHFEESLQSDGLEWAVLKVIQRHNAAKRVIISSFNPLVLRRFRALNAYIPIGYLYAPDEPAYLRRPYLMAGLHYQALHPYHGMVTPEFMERARLAQKSVNTWTVDDPDQMRHLRDLRVNAIITNRPDLAIATLRGA
jgi:glycerophosphoryl diester phosphodiesterase